MIRAYYDANYSSNSSVSRTAQLRCVPMRLR